jgi:hypothetical protein
MADAIELGVERVNKEIKTDISLYYIHQDSYTYIQNISLTGTCWNI